MTSPTNESSQSQPRGEHVQPTPVKYKRRRGRTSLIAHGTPWVWIAGGALATASIMILGLLILVFYQGATTFVPGTIYYMELRTGDKLMGELARVETYQLRAMDTARFPEASREVIEPKFRPIFNPEFALMVEKFESWTRPEADKPFAEELREIVNSKENQNSYIQQLLGMRDQLDSYYTAKRSEIEAARSAAVTRINTLRKALAESSTIDDLSPEQMQAELDEISNKYDQEYQSDLAKLVEVQLAKQELNLLLDRVRLPVTRYLIRTANFDLTNTHYTWVDELEINDEGMTEPEWAVILERRLNGRFYGFPEEFKVGDEVVAEGSEASWEKYETYIDEVTSLYDQRRDLEKYDIGEVNRELEAQRLNLRRAELEHNPPVIWMSAWRTLDRVLAGGTEEEIQAAKDDLELVEKEVGTPSAEFLEAIKQYEKERKIGQEKYLEISKKIAELNAEMDQYQILIKTASDREKYIKLSDVVRAYPANRVSFGDKVSIYISRWVEFLLDDPREANAEGGVFPAIIGTVVMTMIMSLAVVPFGVLAALFLREYAKGGLIVSIVRIAINNLAGVPSIVFGVFGLGFFCYGVGAFIDGGPERISIEPWPAPIWFIGMAILVVLAVISFFVGMAAMKPRKPGDTGILKTWLSRGSICLWLLCTASFVLLLLHMPFFDGFYRAKLPSPTFGTGGLLWASLTLALLTLPVVIVATEEALASVPGSMRDGSYACGASKWQTIQRIVLPRAMPGIMTGTILAMARGAGEVAPLMLVGVVKLAPELPVDGIYPYLHAERSFMHLGFHIYDLGFQSQNAEAAKPMVFTTTLLLITIIVVLNITAIALRARLKRRFVANQF